MPTLLDAPAITSECFALCSTMQSSTSAILTQLNVEHNLKRDSIAPFTDFISARAKTVLQIANEQNIVDAEIIFRALIESFVKLSYIIVPDDEESIDKRIDEFYNIIPEIEDFRTSVRSREMMKQDTAGGIKTFLLGSILPKEEEDKIKAKYNFVNDNKSPVAQSLDTKWGFGNLVMRFGNEKIYKGSLGFTLVDMRKAWVNASSFSHAGPGAIRFIGQRNARPVVERSNSNLMHIFTLMYSATVYQVWAALILADFLDKTSIKQSIFDTYIPIRQRLLQIKEVIIREVLSAPRYTGA